MNKDEFRQWIYDNFNVPGDNCTLAPEMLDNILDYAEAICKTDGEYEAYRFLSEMLPSIPERDILRYAVYKYNDS